MTDEDKTLSVYLVEVDGTMFITATPELAKDLAEDRADDYFGRPVEWTKPTDNSDYWEGRFYDGPNRNGLITITGMEVLT